MRDERIIAEAVGEAMRKCSADDVQKIQYIKDEHGIKVKITFKTGKKLFSMKAGSRKVTVCDMHRIQIG